MAAFSVADPLSRGSDEERILVLFSAFLTTVIGETVVSWALLHLTGHAFSIVGLLIVMIVPLGCRRTCLGIGLGELFVNAWFAGVSFGVVTAVSTVAAAFVCHTLSTPWMRESRRSALHLVAVAVLTVVALAASAGTLVELTGRSSFSVHFVSVIVRALPVTLIGLPPLWVLIRKQGLFEEHQMASSTTREQYLVSAIVVFWATAAYWVNFVFTAFSLVPPVYLDRRLSPVVRTVYDLSGHGSYAVLVIGIVALLMIRYVVSRSS